MAAITSRTCLRAGSAALFTTSSQGRATEHTQPTMQKPGLIAGWPGPPPPMKKARREVPLPSQEGTKGVIQYAL